MMLSQVALKALSYARITQTSFLPISTSCINSNYNYDKPYIQRPDQDESENNGDKKLREWRESFEAKEPIIPVNPDNSFFSFFRTKIELTPWGIKKYLQKKRVEQQIELQKFEPQTHKIFGGDLASAYFLIFAGGKVKFKGKDQWISMKSDETNVDLPKTFDPNYILSEIDASECILHYEGLENFKDCPRVKRANFAKSKEIDDWCVDRIAGYFPFIEHLDLSDCPKVSERGLEALYKTAMLQTLIVTNHYKSAAFELTCMMLEDTVPGLQIDIREPKEKMIPPINEQ